MKSAVFEVTLAGVTKVYTDSDIYVPYGSQIDLKMIPLPEGTEYTFRLYDPDSAGDVISRMQSVNLTKNPEAESIDKYLFKSYTPSNENYVAKDVRLKGVSDLSLTLSTESTEINSGDTVTLPTGTIITAKSSGGDGAKSYSHNHSWVDPTGLSHPNSNKIIVEKPGLYSVTVEDTELQKITYSFAVLEECAKSASISVVKFVVDDQPVCCGSTYVKQCGVVARACGEPPNPQIPSCSVNIAASITSNEDDEFYYTIKVNNVIIGTGIVELLDSTEAITPVYSHSLQRGTSTVTVDFSVIEDDEERVVKTGTAYIRKESRRKQNILQHICTDSTHKTGCPNCVDTLYYNK